MEKEAILAVYGKVSGLMDLMVLAAEAGDWDQLAEFEAHCSVYVDTLRAHDHHEGLTEDERQRKMTFMRKILDDNRRIRELTEPWMKELSGLISRSATSRRINLAYGLNPAG